MKVTVLNTGFMKFDCDIEMQANIFNTSNSNLWTKVRRVFANELKEHYALMRQDRFTEENIMKYLYGEQISQIAGPKDKDHFHAQILVFLLR